MEMKLSGCEGRKMDRNQLNYDNEFRLRKDLDIDFTVTK